jgi:hypothetical protein
VNGSKLWPVWKTKNRVSALLDPRVICDICIAESNTLLAVLETNSLCKQCSTGCCYPPYSLVLFACITVGDRAVSLSCQELVDTWSSVVGNTEQILQDCVSGVMIDFIKCPEGFSPTLVDDAFGPSNNVVDYS